MHVRISGKWIRKGANIRKAIIHVRISEKWIRKGATVRKVIVLTHRRIGWTRTSQISFVQEINNTFAEVTFFSSNLNAKER